MEGCNKNALKAAFGVVASKIEQVSQERVFFLFVCITRVRDVVIVICMSDIFGGMRCGTLDNFVEFTAVEPYAATLRAIIDFNSVAVRHH